MQTPAVIEQAIAEAESQGLRIERLLTRSRKHIYDQRLILIHGKRCQVIPSRLGHPNEEYPQAEYLPLYLPRSEWPDYLIYVSVEDDPKFWIVPRVQMSKDTGWTPETLERYRGAWELLRQETADTPKQFELLNWQLESVKAAAQKENLKVEFIRTKKSQEGRRFPAIIKRRVLVAGRRCSVFSAARISQDPDKLEHSYVVLKGPQDDWCEFQLYLVRGDPNVFVIPHGHVTKTTSASLDHPELAKYKNAWSLLIGPHEQTAILPIQWTRQTVAPASPSARSVIVQKAALKAESQGLTVQSAGGPGISYRGGQRFLYVSQKRCQVMRATWVISPKGFRYLAFNPPTSAWPEFLIFYSSGPAPGDLERYFVIPRAVLTGRISRSIESAWLKEHEEAWHRLI